MIRFLNSIDTLELIKFDLRTMLDLRTKIFMIRCFSRISKKSAYHWLVVSRKIFNMSLTSCSNRSYNSRELYIADIESCRRNDDFNYWSWSIVLKQSIVNFAKIDWENARRSRCNYFSWRFEKNKRYSFSFETCIFSSYDSWALTSFKMILSMRF